MSRLKPFSCVHVGKLLGGSLGVLVLLAATSLSLQAQPLPVFIAVLQSGQEVPPTGSRSFGNAFMTLDFSTRELCYSISYTDLESTETAAHFHGPARPGVNAGILFDITPAPSPVGSPKTGCVGPLTSAQIQDLVRGLLYINVHSETHPGGEIRGQVLFQGVIP